MEGAADVCRGEAWGCTFLGRVCALVPRRRVLSGFSKQLSDELGASHALGSDAGTLVSFTHIASCILFEFIHFIRVAVADVDWARRPPALSWWCSHCLLILNVLWLPVLKVTWQLKLVAPRHPSRRGVAMLATNCPDIPRIVCHSASVWRCHTNASIVRVCAYMCLW